MIKLIKAFPYDNSYDYVKMFSTKQEQDTYFNTLENEIIDDTNYIKVENSFNVNYEYDYLENEGVNYVIFNNGYKDIYAFIIKKEYIRKEVTRIIYEVDVIQTYMFNFTVGNSFIERKVCNINEISDYDEGLYIGEHSITQDITAIAKTSRYFAMFNGFKEQELIFNDSGKLVSVVDIPYSTSKPLTTIDNVQYPLYFMPLLEQSQYKTALYEDVGISSGGSVVSGDAISKKIYRFLKGYEAFASTSYLDSGGVPTIGYGITESNPYWNSLFPLCTEEKASRVLAETLFNTYATPLYKDMQSCGVDMATVKQNHFDAFLSLAFNGGLGAVTSSPMYAKWIVNKNDGTIINDWATWYIRDNNGNVLQGLIDRRAKEIEIFQNNNYIFKPIGLVDSDGNISGTVTDNNGNGFIPSELGGDL